MKTIAYIILFIVLTFLVFSKKMTEDGAYLTFMFFFMIPFAKKIILKKKE